jgi:hypothetical protein
MLDCFDRRAVTADELSVLCPSPQRAAGSDAEGWQLDDVLGEQSHPFFRIDRLTVTGTAPWPYPARYAVVIVTAGEGVAETRHGALPIRRGDTLAVLGATAPPTISGDLELVVSTPSFV